MSSDLAQGLSEHCVDSVNLFQVVLVRPSVGLRCAHDLGGSFLLVVGGITQTWGREVNESEKKNRWWFLGVLVVY